MPYGLRGSKGDCRSRAASMPCLFLLLMGTLLYAGSAVGARSHADAPQELNVVWIVLDACRADHLGCYGYGRPTSPTIDRLAAEGTLFESCYSQANMTVSSVPSYLTGKYFPCALFPEQGWKRCAKIRPPDERTIVEVLHEKGYTTGMVSASPWTWEQSRIYRMFDVPLQVAPEERKVYAEFPLLLDAIEDFLCQAKGKPFFLYVHTMDTHGPHYQGSPCAEWFPGGRVNAQAQAPFDQVEKEWLRAQYDSSIVFADQGVGGVVALLEREGLLQNTLLVIMSDHGELLGEDGKSVGHGGERYFDELYQVPLIMIGPGVPEGKRIAGLAQNVDIVPTLYDLLGLNTPVVTDGRSLTGALHRGTLDRAYAFAHHGEGRVFILKGPRHKMVYKVATGKSQMYTGPHRLNEATPLENPNEVHATMMDAVTERYRPLFDAHEALPEESPDVFTAYVVKSQISPHDHIVFSAIDEAMVDDKWTLEGSWLRCEPRSEDPPPVTIAFPAPNGSYHVDISVLTNNSVLAVRAESETDLRPVPSPEAAQKLTDSATDRAYVPLGDYQIDDGMFELVVDNYDRQHAASLCMRFRFIGTDVTADAAPLATEFDKDREEQLEALGYLE